MRDEVRYLLVELCARGLRVGAVARLVSAAQGLFFLLVATTDSYLLHKLFVCLTRALSLAFKNNAEKRVISLLTKKMPDQPQYFLRLFMGSSEARAILREFEGHGAEAQARIRFPRKDDEQRRQGDLVVLKRYVSPAEKGVLLVQYNDSMKRFAALYDLSKVSRQYQIVLEPSTWGYQYLEFLNFLDLGTDVVVEAQRKEDFEYIKRVGGNLIPVRLGAGDWMDPSLFKEADHTAARRYDLIMVASWLTLKRHDLLLRELVKIRGAISKIALVGYPINGRTLHDIKKTAKSYGVTDLVDFFEDIPNQQVGDLLRDSKFSIMLSKREGANKALYESLFSNVPVIVSEDNVGINRDHINMETGIFTSDLRLHQSIMYMQRHHSDYAPRKWAIENTGCYNSTNTLNTLLRELSLKRGGQWTCGIYQRRGSGKHIVFHDGYYAEAAEEFRFLQKHFLRT